MTSFFHRCAAAWRNVSRLPQVERELDDELRSTYAMMVDEKTAAGISRREAERAVRLELTPEQVKEQVRASRSGARVESILKDARYALRALARTPGFTAVTLLTLALGIGVNTAMFSALRAVSMNALPFRDSDRLVMVWEEASWAGFPQNTPAAGNYHDWIRMNHVFSDLAATRPATGIFTGDAPPEQLRGRAVTTNFFSTLGVEASAGRTLNGGDDRSGEELMVISDRLWARRYGRDPSLIGRAVLVNGARVTIVGVLPPAFVFRDRDIDFWRLLRFTPEDAVNRGRHVLNVVGRLRPGATLPQARADMQAIAARLAAAYPNTNRQTGAVVVPLADDVLGSSRLAVTVLSAAALCVLLIACANLAGLLLSRGVRRRGELAMRVALGASGGRLRQQALVESLLLALAGGALGLLLAPAGIRVLAQLMPIGLPLDRPVLDLRLMLFAFALSIATGVLCGITPAILAARSALQSQLQQDGRSAVRGHHRMRDALVVAQIAIALVLLAGAGLMLRTLANLRNLEIGFSAGQLVAARTTLPAQRYEDPQRRLSFYAQVIDAARALPGVSAAAYVSTVPFAERGNSSGYIVDGQPPDTRFQDALFRVGTGTYLATLGANPIEGRLLGEQDGPDAPKAVVVNRTFARLHWPSSTALGHRVSFDGPGGPWRTIVGVVADIRERGYLPEAKPAIYVPFAQALDTWAMPEYLVVRTAQDQASLGAAVRQIVSRVDPEQPVATIRTMEDLVAGDVVDRRQQLTLLAAFAGLAVLLATVGLYGLLSYNVAQRRREFGVRMALGASVWAVTGLALAHGVALIGTGLAIGGALAALTTRALNALLYGIRPTDPTTFVAVAAILGVVSLGACALPAFRAARLDPASVLRDE